MSNAARIAPAPIYEDPEYNSARDACLVYNRQERCWWIVYPAARVGTDEPGFSFTHGNDIRAASTPDRGLTWRYRGPLWGIPFERGRNTYWAPDIIWHEGLYHAYIAYVRGVHADFSGQRHIIHYTSGNLRDWSLESILELSSDRCLDGCIHPLPDGRWRLWYKDERKKGQTWAADSRDLYRFEVAGAVMETNSEGVDIFFWKGFYWMLFDPVGPYDGLGLCRSDDGLAWQRQENILHKPGTRKDDDCPAHHGEVIVDGDNAYIFYFTLPDIGKVAAQNRPWTSADWRAVMQVARLEFSDGKVICDRDKPFDLLLADP